MSGYWEEPYESSGSSDEGSRDSPPPSPPHQRRTTLVTAAAERSPPPSSPEYSSGGDDYGDELPDYLARLGAWWLDEEDEEEEEELSGPLRRLSLGAARRQQAAPESDEEPAGEQPFIGLADFSEAQPEQPAQPERALFLRLNRLFKLSECRTTLAECQGDWLRAHWSLRQRAAALLAISLPPSKDEHAAHVEACWERGRGEEREQLAPLRREECALQQRRAAAEWQGDMAAVQQADQQLAELQQRCFGIQHETSYAILQRVNKWSMSVETVDVHAQRVADARRIVADVVWQNTQQWPPYRHGRHMVVFITGRGNHSGEAGSQLRPAVEKELEEHSIRFREDSYAVCAFFLPPTAA